jgi:hypothetical protein
MVREKQKPKIRPQEGFGFGLNLLPKPGSPERSDGNPKPPRLEDGKGKAKAENPTAGRIWLWIESPPKTWIAGAQRRQSQAPKA